MPRLPRAPLRAGRSLAGFGLILGLVLAPATPGQAQSFGVRGGTTLSSVYFPAAGGFAETTAFTPGVLAGGYAGLGLPWGLGLQIEGLFALERAKVQDAVESQFRYVDIPVLVRRALPGMRVRGQSVTIEGGAVYRRLLSARDSYVGESFSITDGVRSDDVLLAVGAVIPATAKWSVDVRYRHGQNGLYKRFDGSYSGKWRSIEVAARYAIKR